MRRVGDPSFARRVRGLVEELGLVDVAQDGWTCMVRGGEPMARFDAAAIRMGAAPMIGAGLLSQDEFESVQRLSDGPGVHVSGV